MKVKKSGLRVSISVEHIPEAIAKLRLELATILRDEADGEADPRVARRLREIAADFEAGQRNRR